LGSFWTENKNGGGKNSRELEDFFEGSLDPFIATPISFVAGRLPGSGSDRRTRFESPYPCCSLEDVAMVNFDPTPYWRSTVGFDHLFDLLANATLPQAQDNYPPYNIARADEDNYRISLAVAGFTPEEISITAEQNQLTVEGQKRSQQNTQYLYQGISARAFRRTFNLADHVKVKGATFEHGLLEIDLVREVPEAMKPRRIEISTKTDRDGQVLENESAGSTDKKIEQLKRG
jgi:molecular chaperone IbpA